MDDNTVIKVENLHKKFTRNLRWSMIHGTTDLFRDFVGVPKKDHSLRKEEFWSLKDVNFELKKGEALGLIGRNGSGKSTLLRLLSGIFPPDKGSISIKGKVGALIAVGAGFHPHMTGRENIFLNGTILGMTNKQIRDKFDEIVEFSEIAEFLDAPVSTYSSGMRVRLGFAIAVHSVPDILLVDEILSVGDLSFQQKSMAKMSEVINQGTSLVFVSHNMVTVQRVCDRAILLHKGEIISEGAPKDVVGDYNRVSMSTDHLDSIAPKSLVSSYGISYKYIKFFNSKGEETRKFESGDDITVEWMFDVPQPLEDVVLHLTLSDGPMSWNSYATKYDGVKVEKLDSDTKIRLTLNKVFLSDGDYTVSIGVWDKDFIGSYFWDYTTTGTIRIDSKTILQGRFQFEHNWEITNG